MNRPRSKSVANRVRASILSKGVGHVWTYSDFDKLPFMSVAAELSRLARKGVLRRVNKGIYYFGTDKPKESVVAEALLRSKDAGVDDNGLSAAIAKAVGSAVEQVLKARRVA